MSLRLLTRRKPLLLIAGAFLIIIILRLMRGNDISWDEVGLEDMGRVKRDPDLRADKWIIVTTIQPPTSAMQKFTRMSGWKVLVVADRKTPRNYNLPGAIILDTASQKALGYEVYQYIPFDSYARKMIGYLYAIEHGAKYIFDSDDDNYFDNLDDFSLTLSKSEMLVLKTKSLAVNFYRHFGQSTMWPRGYPLDSIGDESDREYTLCEVHTPAIQQALVNGDPDVDALYRLTRKHLYTNLDVKFDAGAPPFLLPKGSFSPTNAQNAMYTMKAFWSLVIPVSVSDRVSDIYRSYWAQRLLWEVGENAGYYPPNGVHQRNIHSHMLDAVDENDLYRYAGQLLKYLSKWTCSKTMFFECIIDLTHKLAEEGFLKKRDLYLVESWLSDLSTAGYTSPVIRPGSGCYSSKNALDVIFYPDEQNFTLPHSPQPHLPQDAVNHREVESFLADTCGPSHVHYWQVMRRTAHIFPSTLLVISIQNNPQDVIPALESVYQAHFPHRVYCGPKISKDLAFLQQWKVTYITPTSGSISGVSCLLEASRIKHKVDSYLHLTDNMMLHVGESIQKKQSNMVWVTGEIDAYKPEMTALCRGKEIDCVPITKTIISQMNRQVNEMGNLSQYKGRLKECFAKLAADPSFQMQPELLWVREMAFRVPVRSLPLFHELGTYYTRDSSRVKFDFMSLLLMECLEHAVEYLSHASFKDLNLDENKLDFLFPYRLSNLKSNEEIHEHFCNTFERYNV